MPRAVLSTFYVLIQRFSTWNQHIEVAHRCSTWNQHISLAHRCSTLLWHTSSVHRICTQFQHTAAAHTHFNCTCCSVCVAHKTCVHTFDTQNQHTVLGHQLYISLSMCCTHEVHISLSAPVHAFTGNTLSHTPPWPLLLSKTFQLCLLPPHCFFFLFPVAFFLPLTTSS
jgi:hypothetical protein